MIPTLSEKLQSGAFTTRSEFSLRAFALTCLIVTLWINASEIFRYFIFVMPMIRQTLQMVPDIAPMNVPVFFLWGLWDSILTIVSVWFYWLHMERFGGSLKTALISGTTSWLFLFVLFWIAMFNMGLSTLETPAIALPLAWLEMVVAGFIAGKCFQRFIPVQQGA